VPHDLARDQCAEAQTLGKGCRFISYEGGDHFIAVSQSTDIRERRRLRR
jgi:hypothetical protein